MCEICGCYPCRSACPNAPEPQPVYECEDCGEGIYDGDNYYSISGLILCEDCIGGYLCTCEAPEPPEVDAMDVYKRWVEREMCDAEF